MPFVKTPPEPGPRSLKYIQQKEGKQQVSHLYYRTWAKISKYIQEKEGKQQVRHLYYRTWAKISKYIQQKEGKQQMIPSVPQNLGQDLQVYSPKGR